MQPCSACVQPSNTQGACMQVALMQYQGTLAGRGTSNIDHGGSPVVLVCKLHQCSIKAQLAGVEVM